MRKRQAKKRPLLPDPRFNDQLVTRFVNMLMWDGKKSVAFSIFYDALEIIKERNQEDEKTPLEIWKDALSNVMPHVEVEVEELGATFQIPMQIRPDRKVSLAMKWLISFQEEMKINGIRCTEILAARKKKEQQLRKELILKDGRANKHSHFRF